MIVRGMDEFECKSHEHQNGNYFQKHHDVVRSRRLFDAAHQNHRQQHHDDEGGPVKPKMPARRVERVSLQVAQSAGEIGRRNPSRIGVQPEPIEQAHHVRRKTDAYGHIADGIFKNEIPADDPGDEFPHRRVRVGVRTAGNGNHGGKLRVAHRREAANDRHQNEGNSDGRPGAGASKRSGMMDQVFKKRGVQDGRSLELLSGNGRADDGKDAGADDRTDSQ